MVDLPMTKPMKGEAIDSVDQVKHPCFASVKIDGFRCVLGEQPFTSRFSRFPNHHVMRELSGLLPPGIVLDGEIVVGKRRGKGVLGRTSSGVTSEEGKPDWRFWVFDCIEDGDLTVPFKSRYIRAREIVEQLNNPRIRLVKHKLIRDGVHLSDYAEAAVDAGFEGIMVRYIDGPYKSGKSTVKQGWLVKLKPFVDSEGEVTGFFEEEQNTNEEKRDATGKLKRSSAKGGKVGKGTLGGLILRDLTSGVEVRVGGGFTKAQRASLWRIRNRLIGQVVTYSKQKVGEKDKPRHPNFVAFRHAFDFDPKD